MSPVVVRLVVSAVAILTIPHQVVIAADRSDGGHGSAQASQRLMKELKDFYKSDSYKNGIFTVELVDDSIYDWHVKVFLKDKNSPLYRDLQEWKGKGGQDHLLLHVHYNENYPNEPPFVRVVYPYLHHNILRNGAICMEQLGTGWDSSYAIEPLILHIVLEKLYWSRISYTERCFMTQYTFEDAKADFEQTKAQHIQDGTWTTTQKPKE